MGKTKEHNAEPRKKTQAREGPITGTSREDRERSTGRGQTKKRNHRKRKKRKLKKRRVMEVENKPQPMAGFAVGILSPGKRTEQVKRKPEQAQAPSMKIPKLDLGQVWFGESSQSA